MAANRYYPITNRYSWRALIRERPEEYAAFRSQYKETKKKMEDDKQKESGLERRIVPY